MTKITLTADQLDTVRMNGLGDYVKVESPISKAAAYLYTTRLGQFAARYYTGNSRKSASYCYPSEAFRAERVAAFFEDAKAREVERLRRKNAGHNFAVGDIVYCSWGIEQTNVDFYEVVGVSAKAIEMRQIAKTETTLTGFSDRGFCEPVPGKFLGDAFTAKACDSDTVVQGSRAFLWDGTARAWSDYA